MKVSRIITIILWIVLLLISWLWSNAYAEMKSNMSSIIDNRLEVLYQKVDSKKLNNTREFNLYAQLVKKIDSLYNITESEEKRELLSYIKSQIEKQMIPSDIEIIKDYTESIQAGYSPSTHQVMILVNNRVIIKNLAASAGQDHPLKEKESLLWFWTEFDFSSSYDEFHREKADEYISSIDIKMLDDDIIFINNQQHFFFMQYIINKNNNKKLVLKQQQEENITINKNLIIIANVWYEILDGVKVYDKETLSIIQE